MIIEAPDDMYGEVWYLSSGDTVDSWRAENLSDDEIDDVYPEFMIDVGAAFLEAQFARRKLTVGRPWPRRPVSTLTPSVGTSPVYAPTLSS